MSRVRASTMIKMPLRVSKPPAFNSSSLSPAAMDPSSLAALNKLAESPPAQLKRSLNPSSPLVLYVFRVPGRQDFCLSLNKPLGDVITDIDISAAFYYARCDDAQTGRYTLLRRDPARDRISEVAMAVESASHIDVFAVKYGYIEETYWRMNGNEVMTAKSNFGCTIWREEQPAISFTFLSPWTGRCVFRSVKAAHALRCTYNFPKFAPDEDAMLSELRFNFSGHRRTVKSNFQHSTEDTNRDSIVEPKRGSFDLDRILQGIRAAESAGSARQSKLYGPNPLKQADLTSGRARAISEADVDAPKEGPTKHRIPRRPVQSEHDTTSSSANAATKTSNTLNPPTKPVIRRKEVGSGDNSEHRSSVPSGTPQGQDALLSTGVVQEPSDFKIADSGILSSSPDADDKIQVPKESSDIPPALPRRPVDNQSISSPELDRSISPTADISPILPARGLLRSSTDDYFSIPETLNNVSDAPPALPRRPVAKPTEQQVPSEEQTHLPDVEPPPTLPPRPNPSEEQPSQPTNASTQNSNEQGEEPYAANHDPNDLSLGREKLGGGSDGEQAKLGKMVIYQDGQQMLDMIVAANFLMFYKAYRAAVTAQPGDVEPRRRSMSLLDLEGHWQHRRGGWS